MFDSIATDGDINTVADRIVCVQVGNGAARQGRWSTLERYDHVAGHQSGSLCRTSSVDLHYHGAARGRHDSAWFVSVHQSVADTEAFSGGVAVESLQERLILGDGQQAGATLLERVEHRVGRYQPGTSRVLDVVDRHTHGFELRSGKSARRRGAGRARREARRRHAPGGVLGQAGNVNGVDEAIHGPAVGHAQHGEIVGRVVARHPVRVTRARRLPRRGSGLLRLQVHRGRSRRHDQQQRQRNGSRRDQQGPRRIRPRKPPAPRTVPQALRRRDGAAGRRGAVARHDPTWSTLG